MDGELVLLRLLVDWRSVCCEADSVEPSTFVLRGIDNLRLLRELFTAAVASVSAPNSSSCVVLLLFFCGVGEDAICCCATDVAVEGLGKPR